MKRFVRHIFLFLLAALPVYLLLLCLLGDLGCVRTASTRMGNPGHACTCTRLRDLRSHHDIDVLFIGSSHAYRTFDTRYYRAHGISCFNLGTSNQTPVQSLVLLTDHLDSLRPRCVVFEVHPDIIGNDGIESTVDLLVNTPVTPSLTHMAWRTGNMKVFNSWFYALYSQRLRHRLDHFAEDSIVNRWAYVPGGYVEVNDNRFAVETLPPTAITPRNEQLRALRECLELFDQRGIPCLLVEVPDAAQLRDSYTNLGDFQEQMAALGPFRCDTLPLVDTLHFYNNDHLNTAGVALYNEWFLPVLEDFMADHGIYPSTPKDTLCAY